MQSSAHSHLSQSSLSSSGLMSLAGLLIQSDCNNNINQDKVHLVSTNGCNEGGQENHQHSATDCCSLHCCINHAAIVYSYKPVDFSIQVRFFISNNSKQVNFQNSIYRPPIA